MNEERDNPMSGRQRRKRGSRARRIAWLGLLAPALLAPGAAGQPAAPTLDEIVTLLGSSDVRARETATDVLASDDRFTSEDLAHVAERTELSVEQRQRLLEAARQRFMGTPRAALGVRFSPTVLRERVVIERTFPQFPSSKVLEPGDLIVEVEGEKLRGYDSQLVLGGHIISRDPGQTLSLIVRRGEQKLSLEIELGRFSDLQGSQLDEERMNRAWEVRSRGLRWSPERAPIDPGITRAQWQEGGVMSADEARRVRMKMQLPGGQRTVVVPGGRPRGGAVEVDEMQRYAQQGRLPGWMDARIQQREAMAQWRAMTQGTVQMTPEQEVAALDVAIRQQEMRLQQLADAAAQRADRGAFDREREEAQERLRLLLKQLQAVRAEAEEESQAGGAPPK